MYKCEQEQQDLVKKNHRRKQNTMADTTEQSDSFCGRQHSGSVVVAAFREIEKMLDGEGCRVWIHVEADHTWLTIRHEAMVGGEEECATTLKYQVDLSGHAMTSSLRQMVDVGAQKERLVSNEHEIAGVASGKSITDMTSQDVVDDFVTTLEAYKIAKRES